MTVGLTKVTRRYLTYRIHNNTRQINFLLNFASVLALLSFSTSEIIKDTQKQGKSFFYLGSIVHHFYEHKNKFWM